MIEANWTEFKKINPAEYEKMPCMIIKYNMQEVGILILGAKEAMREKIKGLASLIDSGKPKPGLGLQPAVEASISFSQQRPPENGEQGETINESG